jgi:hypothetical protein
MASQAVIIQETIRTGGALVSEQAIDVYVGVFRVSSIAELLGVDAPSVVSDGRVGFGGDVALCRVHDLQIALLVGWLVGADEFVIVVLVKARTYSEYEQNGFMHILLYTMCYLLYKLYPMGYK